MQAPSRTRIDRSTAIDDVDVVSWEVVRHALPETGGRCGSNSNTALLLLLHPVHGGGAIMHFTDLVVHTGVKQYALSRGGLTSVNVSGNTDIAVALNGGLASHDLFLSL